MTTIHGIPLSPYVRKVLVAMEEKNLDYDVNPVVPFEKTAEFLAMSPLGKIPVYEGDDITLADSSVICSYLEKKHSNNPLYPTDAAGHAKALWFEEFSDSGLIPALVFNVFFQLVVAPKFLDQATDQAIVDNALANEIPPLCQYLETQIGDKEFLVNDTFSIADIAVAAPFINFGYAEQQIDADKFPNLDRYLQDIVSRPSFKKCLATELQLMS